MRRANNNKPLSRRRFLVDSSLAVAGLTGIAAKFPAYIGHQHVGEPLRLGIIGMGSRGCGMASIVKTLPGMVLTACCDVLDLHLQNGLKFSDGKAKAYTDYRKMLEDRDVDGVVITLPEHLHYQAAVDALESGKHVYLEKTMTHTISEALDLVEKVHRYPQLVFQIGHQYRYFALYHKAAEIMSKGWLGTVLQYECQYHRNSDWRRPVPDPQLERHINWRMYKEYSGGLMTELCCHQIDVVNWLANSRPVKVTAMGGIDYWKDGRETYDNIRALYEYPNGVKASVSSILSNAYKGYSLRILGTKATLEIQQSGAFLYGEKSHNVHATVDGVTGATVQSWGQGEPVPLEYANQDEYDRDPTGYALLDFAECIRTGKKPFSNVETGRDAAIAVLLANKSAETGMMQEWVQIEDKS